MNERDDDERGTERLSAAAERARAALRAAPPIYPEPAYRERVRQEFVSGAIQVSGSKVRRARADHEASDGRIAPLRPPRRRGVPVAAWVGASLAAAAALIVVFGAMNRGPMWWVTAARGEGEVRVDGQTVALDDRDAMRRLLVPGAEVEVTGDAELDLCSDGVLAMQLAPGTRMTLPPPPARWVGRHTELYARAGELRVTTGRKFRGVQLAIMSPNAAVQVTGTTFAVIIEEAGTCVCVYEGTAMVGRHRGGEFADMRAVPGGMRRYVYRDERSSDLHDMRDDERTKLASFRESQRPWLEKVATTEPR